MYIHDKKRPLMINLNPNNIFVTRYTGSYRFETSDAATDENFIIKDAFLLESASTAQRLETFKFQCIYIGRYLRTSRLIS